MDRIEKALDELFIKTKGEINSRLEQVSFGIDIKDTQAKGYCYCLKTDGNGNLRTRDLVDFIDSKIVEYAIPKKEIDNAKQYLEETGSPRMYSVLRNKAKKLFTNLEKTGEGGEILLYIMTQEFLRLPQLISKMSLKTSNNVHYHGADGIHVKYDKDTDSLNLYWAEAKMHKRLSDAISECFISLKGFLLDTYGHESTQERDIQLITSHISENINNEELEDLLVRYFDKDDDLSNKLIYKGICFLGFDYDKYPDENDLTKTTNIIKESIELEHKKWYNNLSNKIKSHINLDSKEIHIFLLPFPSVEQFRNYYLEAIK
jgi:hypothetical protein